MNIKKNDNYDINNKEAMSNVIIRTKNLNKENGYSYIYILAIFQDQLEDLRERIRKEYKSKQSEENKDDFNAYFNKIEAYFCRNNVFLKNKSPSLSSKINNLFVYSILVEIGIILLQFAFIFIILNGFFAKQKKLPPFLLVFTRYTTLFIVIIILYSKGKCGNKMLYHSISQKFIYRDETKRIICGLFGLLQIIMIIIFYYCYCYLIFQVGNVIECLATLLSLIVLFKLDEWISYFLIIQDGKIKTYHHNYFEQIWVEEKNKSNKFSFWILVQSIGLVVIAVLIFILA